MQCLRMIRSTLCMAVPRSRYRGSFTLEHASPRAEPELIAFGPALLTGPSTSSGQAQDAGDTLDFYLTAASVKAGRVRFKMPDVDEGAHGIGNLIGYGKKGTEDGSPHALISDLKDQANVLANNPAGHFPAEPIHTGLADAAVAFSSNGLMLPLAGFTAYAGASELKESREERKVLAARQSDTGYDILVMDDALEQCVPNSDEALALGQAIQIAMQEIRATRSHLRHNTCDAAIGASTMVSGGALFVKGAQDIALQAAAMALPGSAGLTTATTVAAIAGTFALGPVAAIGAVALGSVFIHQGRIVERDLRSDQQICKAMQHHTAPLNRTETTYQTFIDRKFASRMRFTARFRRWNAGFLSGACLYAATVVAKVVIGAAALGGAAALLASPIGLGVLLALGIAGGVTMTVCSWQFVKWHFRSKRQQSYRTQETPLLGRRFDALYTGCKSKGRDPFNPTMSSDLRAATYAYVAERDRCRQLFLQSRALGLHTFRAWERRATDPWFAAIRDRPVRFHRETWARLCAGSRYVGQRCLGSSHEHAVLLARQTHSRHAGRLTIQALAEWLNPRVDDHSDAVLSLREDAQREWMLEVLSQHKAFLEIKQQGFESIRATMFETDATAHELNTIYEATKTEAAEAAQRLTDIDRLSCALEAREALGSRQTPEQIAQLNRLKLDFLKLQGVHADTLPRAVDVAEVNLRFARFLMKDLARELTTTRGILFDMHRHAGSLVQGLTRRCLGRETVVDTPRRRNAPSTSGLTVRRLSI